jgi:hypothetical protein
VVFLWPRILWVAAKGENLADGWHLWGIQPKRSCQGISQCLYRQGKGGPLLEAMLAVCSGGKDPFPYSAKTWKRVAGAGFEPATFRL